MLLAVDVGNSQTVVGLFDGPDLKVRWRLTSAATRTGDEIAVNLRALLRDADTDPGAVSAVTVASVVPGLTEAYGDAARRLFGLDPLSVDHTTVRLPIRHLDPSSVGADRLVNAVAAIAAHGAPVIVVDLGTATTFDVIDADGGYLGGVITPGVGISAEALFQRGARLGKVEIRRPARVVGRTTEESLQAGIFHGAVGGVDHIVEAILAETGFPATTPVVATGGLAAAVAEASRTVTAVDEDLTLHGIRRVTETAGG